jgi:predicted flap endonuclease-1-like 5' DNA nuclease
MIDKSIILDNKKFTLGIFDDSDKLLHAVKTLKSKGVKIFDCYTPFPVHHLDKELGYNRTNLTVGAFLCGLIGSLSGFTLGYYMNVVDWPMIIGGKPTDIKMLTSFIPIIFELTILFTAFGMVILFFIRSRMLHGIKEDLLHIRQTNDRLVLAIDDSVEQDISNEEIQRILKDEGAVEVDSGKEAFNTSHTDLEALPVSEVKSTASATSSDETTEAPAELSAEAKAEKLNLLSETLGTVEEGTKDDLKKISGVGPVYEKTLNGIGIYTFEQVSKLTPETIKAIEELTGYFPGRIERDNWIGQAKDLMNN